MSKNDGVQEKHIKALEQMLKLPENKECAECGSKNPRWASTNLGVFVCIRCSGIHRNLGTHISKVKSVSLDKWTDELVEFMKSMGNARAADIWEYGLPEDFRRPEDTHAVEVFIRNKYERKLYYNKSASGGNKNKKRTENKSNGSLPAPPSPRNDQRPQQHYQQQQQQYQNNHQPQQPSESLLFLNETPVTPQPGLLPPPQPNHQQFGFPPSQSNQHAQAQPNFAPTPSPQVQQNSIEALFSDPKLPAKSANAVTKESILSLYNTPAAPSPYLNYGNSQARGPNMMYGATQVNHMPPAGYNHFQPNTTPMGMMPNLAGFGANGAHMGMAGIGYQANPYQQQQQQLGHYQQGYHQPAYQTPAANVGYGAAGYGAAGYGAVSNQGQQPQFNFGLK
eukprot:TRINITY_DN1541_c0_g1_i2.p1 TRINITY_DN1541_c0_g1~~TRINITY_DN1541_c0_g1_i2.p1  ORF type:complete len:411 (-),score=92.99 TRINITY_DN1541_c0_g1_i2:124-1302(-)